MDRSKLWKAALAGMLLISVTCSIFLYVQNQNIAASYEKVMAEKATETKNLKEDVSGLENQLREQKEILDSRQGFLESVSKAKAALIEAGKVSDVTKSRELVETAQEVVYLERDDADTITVQTAAVDKEIGKLFELTSSGEKALLKTDSSISYSDLLEELPGLRTLSSDHPARLALDAVGGLDIKLGAAPLVCGREDSMACAYPTGVILMVEDYADENYDFYYPVMMHEYAHQVQFKHGQELDRSSQYEQLFGRDGEWLADCMAASKIPGYSSNYQYECSQAQKEYGAGAWKGLFP